MLQEGLTAVYKASQKGHSKIIQLLLKAGAHVDEANDVSTSCIEVNKQSILLQLRA